MEEFKQENSDSDKQDEVLADDAMPLCPNCLEPCNPLDNYCPNCGSNEVINPLASYMPFEGIRFETGIIGKLWQKAWAGETEWFDRGIYFGLFILFYPVILIIGVPYILYEKLKRSRRKSALSQKSE